MSTTPVVYFCLTVVDLWTGSQNRRGQEGEDAEEVEELVDSGVVPVPTASTVTSSNSAAEASPLAEAIKQIQRAQAQQQQLVSTAAASQHQIRELEGRCRELADMKKSADAEAAKLKRELADLQGRENAAGARDQALLDALTAEKERLSAELEQQQRQLDGQIVSLKKEVDRLLKDVERLRLERNRYGDEATDLRRKMHIISGLIPVPSRGENRQHQDHNQAKRS